MLSADMKLIMIYLDGIAPLIPVLYSLTFRKQILKELFFLIIYLLSQFIFNTLADILSYYPFPNYFVYHLALPISFLSLIFFFKQNGKKIFYTSVFYKTGLFLIIFFILNSLFFEKINSFNSISYTLSSLYILVVCLNYFWLKINSDSSKDILSQPDFWFISGFFIYYCSSFIVFSVYKFFIESNDQLAWVAWQFQSCMLLVMCVMITKGIKQKYKCQMH
jgi:hypothetical protein